MDIFRRRFHGAFPQLSNTVMDDDAGELRQPFISSNSDDNCEAITEENELCDLFFRRPEFDIVTATPRKHQRGKIEEDLEQRIKAYPVSVEPLELLRSTGSWLVLLSTASDLLCQLLALCTDTTDTHPYHPACV
ncbi:hypothetical protein CCR75_005402 [Bremia lactucae]|uniref:Uncharacterized protein n=1 Tax=Bremia lactucae TaxID=4779 RepID=A0A976IBF5_BRELC|nr:hypothetical protein CCR75_005402 [Bremia lactucae]